MQCNLGDPGCSTNNFLKYSTVVQLQTPLIRLLRLLLPLHPDLQGCREHGKGGDTQPTVSWHTLLHFTALYCTVLHCTALYCTALYCTVLHCQLSKPTEGINQTLIVDSTVLHYADNTCKKNTPITLMWCTILWLR